MTDLQHNTVAIAQAGTYRIAGLVQMLKSKDGGEFPSFFTGRADQPMPILFMTEDHERTGIRFELTGQTLDEFWLDNDQEIEIYSAFSEQVFQANLTEPFDAYATLNAGVWMQESKRFRPEEFTHEVVDREVVRGGVIVCMSAYSNQQRFLRLVHENAGKMRVH